MFEGISEDEYRVFVTTLHKVLRNIRKHDISNNDKACSVNFPQ